MSAHGTSAISLLLELSTNRDLLTDVMYTFQKGDPGGQPDPRDNVDKFENVLNGLSLALQKDHSHRTQPTFASGAVYLAQMMAHDVLKTEHPLEGIASKEFNRVRRPFMLDSLYGAGPDIEPHLYDELDKYALAQSEIKPDALRPVFRTGRMINTSFGSPDLPRKEGIDEHGDETYIGCPGVFGAGEPIVADRRNDSHTIIAQLVGVWMRLHNYIYERKSEALIGQHIAWLQHEGMEHQIGEYRFRATQQAMRFIWHSVIEHDVLPILFQDHSELLKEIEMRLALQNAQPPKLDPPSGATTALRSLHSLVREKYTLITEERDHVLSQMGRKVERKGHGLNEILSIGFSQDQKWPGQIFPNHNDNWAISWREFFDSGTHNKASNRTRYRVHYVSQLTFGPSEKNQTLMFLDFIRSMMTEKKIARNDEHYALLDKLHSDDELREFVLSRVEDRQLQSEFSSMQLPTTLMILSEAELRANGLSLGEIGTELLAPWLLGHLAIAKSTIEIDFSLADLPRTMVEIFELFEPLAITENGSKKEERTTS